MPWVVGVDEAGYGPNLGPLVQAAVALRLPGDDPAGWRTLAAVVRRCGEKADGRVLIDDSKRLYARGGVVALEQGVWAAVGWGTVSFGDLLRSVLVPRALEALAGESWFDTTELLPTGPVTGTRLPVPIVASAWLATASVFNRVCDESGSKAVVLTRGWAEVARAALDRLPADGEPVSLLCDKQGGRNFYAGVLQEAFPSGRVAALRESAAESSYRVERLGRPVAVTFRPRAEAEAVPVALASVLCKYLREVCMRQFNRFWAAHVPGLLPTAGYPVDARRFYAAIRPAMAKLGLTDEQVWRKK